MADFAPYIKFSQNSHYLTLPVQTVYPPSDVFGSDPRYRKVENLDYEGSQYISDPLYYIPADNLADEAEQPQDYDDWHNDCLISLRKKVDGEWVFDNKIIVFQHYTRWCNKKSNGNIRDWSMEMRLGLYDTENLTFTEWDHYIFGAGGIASAFEKVDAYVTAYNVPTLAGDQLIGPAYLFKVERTNGQQNFKTYGFVLSKEWFNANGYDDSAFREIEDPNEEDPEGPSGPGGGGGSHDPADDPVVEPEVGPLNTISCLGGFVTLFQANKGNLESLAQSLYTDNILLMLKNYFLSPMDIIAGLLLLPFTPSVGSVYYPKLGTHTFGVGMPVITSQYQVVDCGSLTVSEYYGSCYDYSPYSRLQIWLPFAGMRELDIDEVMGKTLQVKYHIDVMNGDCMIYILVNNSVRYQFSGNVAQQVALTAANFDSVIANAVSFATVAVASVATAGAASAAGAAGAASAAEAGAITAEEAAAISSAAAATANTKAAGDIMSSGISAVMGSKPRVEKSGSSGCGIGQMGVLKPFIVRTIPRQSLPDDYRNFNGYPSNMTAYLSSLSGYTIVDRVKLKGISATDTELAEIESLLKGGVIL